MRERECRCSPSSQRIPNNRCASDSGLRAKLIEKIDQSSNTIIDLRLGRFSKPDLVWSKHSIFCRKCRYGRGPIRPVSSQTMQQNDNWSGSRFNIIDSLPKDCLLYTSDAA